jgi:hypothetical protein
MSKSLIVVLILSGAILTSTAIMDGLESRSRVKQLEVALLTHQLENKELKTKLNSHNPIVDQMVTDSINDMKKGSTIHPTKLNSETKFKNLDADIKKVEDELGLH